MVSKTIKSRVPVLDLMPTPKPVGIGVDNKCGRCTRSICCNSINQQVPTPRSKSDFDHLLWQVAHEGINLFKDSDGWFLHIETGCAHLQTGGFCGIYDKRPAVCRDYSNDFCELDESIPEGSEMFFSTYEQLEQYCRTRFKHWDKRLDLAFAEALSRKTRS